jgi:hypothetical protein
MKNILFVVNTEGQLLTASSLIFEKFNSKFGFHPIIVQFGEIGSARFQNEVNKEFLTNSYYVINKDLSNLKEILNKILHLSFEKVFIFLEQLKLNVFLSYYFKKSRY